MATLPTQQGDSVYADKDGVLIYTEANLEADKQRNGDNGGVISYSKGDFIGTYTGNKIGNFCEIDYVIRYKFGLFKWGVKNRNFTGFVLLNQITTVSPQMTADEKKVADAADFQKQLDAISGSGTTATTATTASGTTSSSNNTLLYLIGGGALLFGGAWLYFNRKKPQPASPTGNPTGSTLISPTYNIVKK